MLVPPASQKGWKVWTVGDDIAWMRIGHDGRLWAMNPETGFFGVVPGTNSKSNPNALAATSRNTIFTNVVLGGDRTVWWEGLDREAPADALDWRGRPWKPGLKDAEGNPVPGAHPNSRFTAPASQCPTISPRWEDPSGVPISAIVFGGRRETTAPLVYEAFDWPHGVYVGATAASERTAAQYGKLGEVRRDPMAMLPFCGYHMGDYFSHWLDMGRRIPNPPRIFHVNWFRKDARGGFLWPGYGDNLRVLEWMLSRCRGHAPARRTPIGWVPAPDALDLSGLSLGAGVMEELLAVRPEEWEAEIEGQQAFFERFAGRIPEEILRQREDLRRRLSTKAAAA
jgi:phosphoenolpyruvate carboxykinase (GTP)